MKDENGEFRKLRIQFGERGCGNKCMCVVYRILRVFFVSFYYYFCPFLTVLFSIMAPIRFQDVNDPVVPVFTTS